MADIHRLRVAWSGNAVVGPGLTTFYVDPSFSAVPAAVVTFLQDIDNYIPTGVTWTVPSGGDILDDATGDLIGAWTGTGGSSVNSIGSGDYAQGVGARIRYSTNGIVAGRRVRGATFVVPLLASLYSGAGILDSTVVTGLQTAANVLLGTAAGDLLVWSRPAPGRAGSSHSITSAVVPNQISWLRSRRT